MFFVSSFLSLRVHLYTLHYFGLGLRRLAQDSRGRKSSICRANEVLLQEIKSCESNFNILTMRNLIGITRVTPARKMQ